jgi:hypothetical protein
MSTDEAVEVLLAEWALASRDWGLRLIAAGRAEVLRARLAPAAPAATAVVAELANARGEAGALVEQHGPAATAPSDAQNSAGAPLSLLLRASSDRHADREERTEKPPLCPIESAHSAAAAIHPAPFAFGAARVSPARQVTPFERAQNGHSANSASVAEKEAKSKSEEKMLRAEGERLRAALDETQRSLLQARAELAARAASAADAKGAGGKHHVKELPAEKGVRGQEIVQGWLEDHFRDFVRVIDVHAPGGQLDIRMETIEDDDRPVRIGIEVKFHSQATLAWNEAERFAEQAEELKETLDAAILFSATRLAGLRIGPRAPIDKGTLLVYRIGKWDREALVGAVLDAIVQTKARRELLKGANGRSVEGSAENRAALTSAVALLRSQREMIESVRRSVRVRIDFKGFGEKMCQAHQKNAELVSGQHVEDVQAWLTGRMRFGSRAAALPPPAAAEAMHSLNEIDQIGEPDVISEKNEVEVGESDFLSESACGRVEPAGGAVSATAHALSLPQKRKAGAGVSELSAMVTRRNLQLQPDPDD